MTKRERSGESVDGCGAQRACRVLSLVGDLQIQRPGLRNAIVLSADTETQRVEHKVKMQRRDPDL